MAASIRERFGIEPELIKSRGGVFEVTLGNQLIYSKKKQKRFPTEGEVEKALADRLEIEEELAAEPS